jgi:hypothetical protein
MFTFIALAILSTLVIGFVLALMHGRKVSNERLADMARFRAIERANARRYEDTSPAEDWKDGVDLNLRIGATELDDAVDGRGKLDDEQKRIIALIMEGHAPAAVQPPKVTSGGSSSYLAGVTRANSVFGAYNQIEPIDPNSPDAWKGSK